MPHANTRPTDANAFRVRAGRCVVADGSIRIERLPGGRFGGLRRGLRRVGADRRRRALALAAGALTALVAPGVLPVLGVLLVAALVRDRYRAWRRGFTDASEIPLDAVVAVAVRDGRGPLSFPRLVVRYREGDDLRRRRVTLPPRTAGRDAELDRAVRLFQARGLTVVEE